jgi:ADP-ribose pyrophosphatase YjhB (NUDIX family)
MCQRAIEPRRGYWTLPGGFMENGESTGQAATRETREEAGAEVDLDAPFALINIPHINQVHLFYRGRLQTPAYSAGEESLDVLLLPPSEIPWKELAFRSVALCLEHYLLDRERAVFGFHEANLYPI